MYCPENALSGKCGVGQMHCRVKVVSGKWCQAIEVSGKHIRPEKVYMCTSVNATKIVRVYNTCVVMI